MTTTNGYAFSCRGCGLENTLSLTVASGPQRCIEKCETCGHTTVVMVSQYANGNYIVSAA